MLDKVRKNVKSFGVQVVIVIVVAAFIGTIFLVWGHGGKSERQGMLLAKVFEMDITYPEYQQEFFLCGQHVITYTIQHVDIAYSLLFLTNPFLWRIHKMLFAYQRNWVYLFSHHVSF